MRLAVEDVVGGSMALDGVGATQAGRASVPVGWRLAQLGQ
jgi:hypothetical protein